MSKRLRASIRAANKGRNLRPRTSQVPPKESDTETLPELPEDDAAEHLAEASPIPAPRKVIVPLPSEAPSTLRPEQIEEREARAEAAAKAEEAARAQAEAAKEKAEAEATKAKAEAEAAKAKAEAEAAKAKAEAEAAAKAEQAARAEAAAKAEQAARAAAKAEQAARAAAKAEQAARAEQAERAEAAAKMATKAKAKVEPSPSKKAQAKTDDVAAKRFPAVVHDDLDHSSISAEFFRADVDSLPPVEEVEEGSIVHQLSPSALARRARLRRIVAGVVAFAGVISIAVVTKAVTKSKKTSSAPVPVAVVEPKRDLPVAKAEEKPQPAPVAVAGEKKAEPVKTEEKKAEEPPKPDDKKAEEPPKPEASSADGAALRKETEKLLNRGKRKEAIEKAREAITADPSEAMAYLYLGSALQDTGKWKEGIEAYCECVRNATKGPVHECRAMGGRK